MKASHPEIRVAGVPNKTGTCAILFHRYRALHVGMGRTMISVDPGLREHLRRVLAVADGARVESPGIACGSMPRLVCVYPCDLLPCRYLYVGRDEREILYLDCCGRRLRGGRGGWLLACRRSSWLGGILRCGWYCRQCGCLFGWLGCGGGWLCALCRRLGGLGGISRAANRQDG